MPSFDALALKVINVSPMKGSDQDLSGDGLEFTKWFRGHRMHDANGRRMSNLHTGMPKASTGIVTEAI
jgi:hypothetical protein